MHERRDGLSIGQLKKALDDRDRKIQELEEALSALQGHSRLLSIFDHAPAFIAIHEGPEHRYVHSNRLHDAAVGHRPLIGRTLKEAMPELKDQGIFERFDQVYESGEPIVVEEFEAKFDRDGDGKLERGYFRQILQPWFFPQDRVAGVISFAFEVTELVRARDSLRQSETTLSAVLDTMPVALIIADREGRIVRDNALNRELWGIPPETTSWEQYHDWAGWWPETGERIKAHEWGMARALLHGEVIRNELILNERFDGGERHYFLNNAAPLRDAEGQIIGGIVAQLDVTDRIAAEEALRQADRAKNEFLAILGHELRNPLAPLQTGIDLLEPAARNPDLLDRIVPMMRRQVSHLVRLVDDLLNISRIARGKIELQQDPLDLNAPVQAAVEQVRHLIDSRQHQLRLECSPDCLTVNGDFERLTQVVANLLSNAAKYTEPGGAITVTTWRELDQANISVRDTGIGMAHDNLTKVFELFSQFAGHQGRDGSAGLGIGLALSRQLVEMHGGTIEAKSEGVGRGSELLVRLPTSRVDREESFVGTREIDQYAPVRRVLIVDDNVDAAESLRILLEIRGHTVEVVYDGAAALQAVEGLKPDLILLDLGLPDMSGIEVGREIRALPGGETVHLIAVTGWGQDEDRAQTKEAGFDDHWTKPVDVAELVSVLAGMDPR
jgi:PAS domain S-box-containing protein